VLAEIKSSETAKEHFGKTWFWADSAGSALGIINPVAITKRCRTNLHFLFDGAIALEKKPVRHFRM